MPVRRMATTQTHEPGQSSFRSALAEDIDWEPFPAFPPEARLAVVVGDPSEPAPYVVRVKVPSGVRLMPHRHHDDRVYTVMSGVFYIGVGERFDEARLEAYPPGAVIVLPGGTPHFRWAKSGEYITQVSATGPRSASTTWITGREAEGDPEGGPPRIGKPIEPIEHRLTELVQAGKGQLQLHPGDPGHPTAGCRLGEVLEERCLADARLALHDESGALAGPDPVEQPVQVLL